MPVGRLALLGSGATWVHSTQQRWLGVPTTARTDITLTSQRHSSLRRRESLTGSSTTHRPPNQGSYTRSAASVF